MTHQSPIASPERVLEHAPFIDESSQQALAWPALWQQFAPCTPYGQRAKRALRPFLPNNAEAFEENAGQLSADMANIAPETGAALCKHLVQLPDIASILQELANGAAILSQKSFLSLKQFAVIGRDCVRATRTHSIHVEGFTEANFAQVTFPFKHTESPTFALDDVATEAYRSCREMHTTALQQHAALMREIDAVWRSRVGKRVNRDRQFVLSLPAERALVMEFKASDEVKWVRETPFESVFELVPTEEMAALQRDIEKWQRALEAEADAVLARLTALIRRDIDVWITLVHAVTALDIRIAKVQLAHRWHGTVPQLAKRSSSRVALRDAVHPLLFARKEAQGASYVPLNIYVTESVNVLCGSNMGGKTVAMSTLCLCQLLAQFGLPVPAVYFETRLFGCIRFLASADTDMDSGLSSFGREVHAMTRAWADVDAAPPSLLCLDEPGRSTNPVEGEAIAVGLLQSAKVHFGQAGMVWMASHYPGVAAMNGVGRYRVGGLKPLQSDATAPPDDFATRLAALAAQMDYRVEPWQTDGAQTDAIAVAAWLGLPREIVAASLDYLSGGTKTDEV